MVTNKRVLATAAVLLGGASLALGDVATAAEASAPSPSQAAALASTWLSTESVDGIFRYAGFPDWGFTADVALGHASAGQGTSHGGATLEALRANAVAMTNVGSTPVSAAGTAKLALVAAVYGQDPTDFGGVNLVTTLNSLMVTSGDNAGLYSDSANPTPAFPNSFTQSYALTAAARIGAGNEAAVAYLLAQQCPDGGFRLEASGTPCTDSTTSDVDSTALAVQALEAASLAGFGDGPTVARSIDAGSAYLVMNQNADGSFSSSGEWGMKNTNTTGLAAQALRATGAIASADLASAYLRSQQLLCEVGEVARGGFAFSEDDLAAARAALALPVGNEDSYRRATAQVILGLGGPSLAILSSDDRAPEGQPVTCETATTTTSTSTSTSAAPTTVVDASSTTAPSSNASTTDAPQATTVLTATTTPGAVVAGISDAQAVSGTQRGSSLAATGGSSAPLTAFALALAAIGAVALAGSLRLRAKSN